MTVDLEDWYQGIEQPFDQWDRFEQRLHIGTERLLEVLAEAETRATFFVLGWVAERHPELLRRLVEQGHEVGSHGYDHEKLYDTDPASLRRALSRAKRATEDACGRAVRGHRAPYFSLTRQSLWAVEVLAELGFEYDSSVYPGTNWRYGIPGSPEDLYELGDSGVAEFPVSTIALRGHRLGIGGAYFRILPLWMTRRGIEHINRRASPAMVYLHPWELDPAHPVYRFRWRAMATHYFNLGATKERLRRLLAGYSFTTMYEVITERRRRGLPVVVLAGMAVASSRPAAPAGAPIRSAAEALDDQLATTRL